MALALLKSIREDESNYIFKADIGTHLFYQYKIGASVRKSRGLSILDEVGFISPLFRVRRPKDQILRTDFVLNIPKYLFTRESGMVQLFSYKNTEGRSPAISSVQKIRQRIAPRGESRELLLPINFSLEKEIMENTIVHNKPFTYKELSYGSGSFWESIMKVLPKIVEVGAPIVKGLLSGGNGSDGDAPTGEGGDNNGEILNAITALIQQIAAQKKETSTAASLSKEAFGTAMGFNPAMLVKLAPILEKVISPETINMIGDQPAKLFKVIGDAALKMRQQEINHLEAINPGVDNPNLMAILASVDFKNKAQSKYVEAKIAPALLAALPALMPVIEKALDPKTIEALVGQPLKLFEAIANAAQKQRKQEIDHLEAINPGVDNPNLMNILNSMSLSAPVLKGIAFSFNPKIEIDFVNVTTIELQKRNKVVYTKDKVIYFPIRIKTNHPNPPNRPFEKAIIQLIVEDSDSMKVLLAKQFKLKNISLGSTIQDISISQEEMSQFPVNKDLKVEVSFIWKSKKTNKKIGTFKTHFITLINQYIFDRIGEGKGAPILMNDIVAHRSVWHKVWEGGFTKSKRWNIDFDLKYFYLLNPNDKEPARLETKKKIIEDNAKGESEEPYRRKVRAKLKGGMEHTLELLNDTLPVFSLPKLEDEKLKALKTDAIKNTFNQAARAALEFKGQSGETASLWAYPELVLHDIILKKISDVNNLGQVIQFEEEVIQFPRPSSIHFIGTTTN